MTLLFKEGSGCHVLVVKVSLLRAPGFSEGGMVFDPCFYRGVRFLKTGEKDGDVVSALYFYSKNGQRPGTYAPYFYVEGRADELRSMLDAVLR
jgi:hypothetical protein